jgi:hypothetical protein
MGVHATRRATALAIILPAIAGFLVAAASPTQPAPLRPPVATSSSDVVPVMQPTPPEPVVKSAPPKTKPKPAAPAAPAQPQTVTLSPVTAYGDQSVLDQGKLVTWWHDPCIIAGHNTDGWAFLANVPVGARVAVTAGACAGTFEVTGHRWVDYRGSETMPAWTANHDLILQSCVDPVGSGFSLARKVG